jgi:hypothetical protein
MTSATERSTTTDPRAYGLQLVIEGVAAGLPVPSAIHMGSDRRVDLQFSRGDTATAAVDRSATYLELPAAELRPHVFDAEGKHPWQTYSAEVHRHVALNGWSVAVWCPAPATAEAVTEATTGGAK